MYGLMGKPISLLTQGTNTLDVERPDPIMRVLVSREAGEQPKDEIKFDGVVMPGKDFGAGKHALEVKFNALSAGKHRVEIKLEKSGYETGNYDFYINYTRLSWMLLFLKV